MSTLYGRGGGGKPFIQLDYTITDTIATHHSAPPLRSPPPPSY